MAKEAAKAKKQASCLLDVEETQAKLTEELAEVCKDYYNVTWAEALNLATVPADSEWRQLRNVYYYLEIREILVALSFPFATAPKSSKQPLTTQVALPLPEALKAFSQASD